MAKVNPNSKRSQIADLAVQIAEHQARLQVIAANWGAEIAEHLNTTEKAFLAGLAKELKGFRFNPNAKETLDRLKKITDRLNTIRRLAYQRAEAKVREEARKLAENEAKWGKRVTKELSAPDVKLKDATPALLDKVVKFGLADGKTLQEYFSGIADADAVRVESSIRQGVESGWTIDQIARNLAGTAEGNYKDGIFETSRKSAVNMARTLCNAVSNNAKDAFYNANSDVINGVEILATLDGRTCPVCAGLDRKRYPIGENHPALPVHHSCRCVLLPVTPLSDMVEEERPMAKSDFMKDAKANYKKRFPNKDFDKLSDSTKKKYYYEAMRLYEQRTGEPAYTQVAGGVSFKDYFTDHMTDEQRKKWLGPERFAIWKRGNLPLDKFIPPYPDKRLTVDALKKMDQDSFYSYTVKRGNKKQEDREFAVKPEFITVNNKINMVQYSPRKGKEQWDAVPDEVKRILEHEKVKDIPKNFMVKNTEGYDGFVTRRLDGKITEWSVSNDAENPALTAIHETGHILDFKFMTPEHRKNILDAIKNSDEYIAMKSRCDSLAKGSDERDKLENWLTDKELIARGYAQYIAQKNGDFLLAQLDNDAKLGVGRVFFSKSDEIRTAFDKTIKEVGL